TCGLTATDARRWNVGGTTQALLLCPCIRAKVREGRFDYFFFFKQKTAYEIGLGIPAEPLFRSALLLRLMNAMRQAHADGWFIVFDTLTLADDRLEAFYDNPNALRDYFRDIGRMVLAAEGRKEIGRASCRERV